MAEIPSRLPASLLLPAAPRTLKEQEALLHQGQHVCGPCVSSGGDQAHGTGIPAHTEGLMGKMTADIRLAWVIGV